MDLPDGSWIAADDVVHERTELVRAADGAIHDDDGAIRRQAGQGALPRRIRRPRSDQVLLTCREERKTERQRDTQSAASLHRASVWQGSFVFLNEVIPRACIRTWNALARWVVKTDDGICTRSSCQWLLGKERQTRGGGGRFFQDSCARGRAGRKRRGAGPEGWARKCGWESTG